MGGTGGEGRGGMCNMSCPRRKLYGGADFKNHILVLKF